MKLSLIGEIILHQLPMTSQVGERLEANAKQKLQDTWEAGDKYNDGLKLISSEIS
jgi:hypothetical protein